MGVAVVVSVSTFSANDSTSIGQISRQNVTR
jgi:hypothetical protein